MSVVFTRSIGSFNVPICVSEESKRADTGIYVSTINKHCYGPNETERLRSNILLHAISVWYLRHSATANEFAIRDGKKLMRID